MKTRPSKMTGEILSSASSHYIENIYPNLPDIPGKTRLHMTLTKTALKHNGVFQRVVTGKNGVYIAGWKYTDNDHSFTMTEKIGFGNIIHEPALVNALKDHVTSNDIVCDIGANTGFYTALLSSKAAHIYAIEADPSNFESLKKTIDLNNAYTNTTAENFAVWSCNTELPADLGKNGTSSVGAGNHTVRSTSLDTYFERKEYPDVLKIDVEGAEKHVLNGSQETLSHARLVFVETHSAELEQDCRDILRDAGFSVKVLDDKAGEVRILMAMSDR